MARLPSIPVRYDVAGLTGCSGEICPTAAGRDEPVRRSQLPGQVRQELVVVLARSRRRRLSFLDRRRGSSGLSKAEGVVLAIPLDDATDEILPDRKELLDLAGILSRLHSRHIFRAHDDKIDLGP